jgi:hypothetical protein
MDALYMTAPQPSLKSKLPLKTGSLQQMLKA